jgi:hypothetical protein
MITQQRPRTGGDGHGRSDAMLVILGVLLGGAVLLGGVEHIHHLGPAVGNVCFVAVPLLAATAAAKRLHQ